MPRPIDLLRLPKGWRSWLCQPLDPARLLWGASGRPQAAAGIPRHPEARGQHTGAQWVPGAPKMVMEGNCSRLLALGDDGEGDNAFLSLHIEPIFYGDVFLFSSAKHPAHHPHPPPYFP
jgi:hypothetical protein